MGERLYENDREELMNQEDGAVGGVPSLAHAWEQHHVLGWLAEVGLGDLIANFRSAKVTGKGLLKFTPKNTAETLNLKDEVSTMRVVAAVMPLVNEWRAARKAAGLPIKLEPDGPSRAKRLVADLHVVLLGPATLPAGATGAYVLLELGDHTAKSAFVPAGSGGYGGYDGHDGHGGYGGYGGYADAGFLLQRPGEPDAFSAGGGRGRLCGPSGPKPLS